MKIKTNVRVGSGGKSTVSTDPATSSATTVSGGGGSGGGGGGGGGGSISGGQAASIALKAQASADYMAALQAYFAATYDPSANMAAATAAMTTASATYTSITGYVGRCAGI
jgi:hypothetical protein